MWQWTTQLLLQHYGKLVSWPEKSLPEGKKRAILHGHTWYKGRHFSPQELGIFTPPNEQQLTLLRTPNCPNQPPPPPSKARRNRLTCVSWNVGALGLHKLDILRSWLCHQHIDIICLQDPHWTFDGEWQDDQYFFVHHAQDNLAGCSPWSKKTLCSSDRLAWRSLTSGRLMHIRM